MLTWSGISDKERKDYSKYQENDSKQGAQREDREYIGFDVGLSRNLHLNYYQTKITLTLNHKKQTNHFTLNLSVECLDLKKGWTVVGNGKIFAFDFLNRMFSVIEIIFKISITQKMTEEVEAHVLARYSLLKKVGSGAYGHVWKVTDRKTNQTLALKKIFDAFQHSIDAQRTYREIVYLHQLNHPNIIKLHNVIKAENDKDLYLVFQFMEADLHNAIGQKILKDLHNRFIMYQILKGMKYLHSTQIIHRDLKPSNILINSDCHLKICDFGLARSLTADTADKDIVLTEEVATRWYRAPQVLLGSQSYQKSADVWSIGCILGQLLLGKPLFPGNSTLNQLQKILTFTGKPKKEDVFSLNTDVAETMIDSITNLKVKPLREWFKSQIPNEALDLLVRMLQFNPNKRITINDALRHPYLSQFHNTKEEVISKKVIIPPVSDNKKLNLKQYKQLIYERIKKIYSEPETPTIIQTKKSASSIHRATEIMKEKTNEYRQSINNQKTNKVGTSAPKYHGPPASSSGSYSNISSSFLNDEQKDKLKKKQSLKDILKNKRQKSVMRSQKSEGKMQKYESTPAYNYTKDYNTKSYGTSPLLAKYYKGPVSVGPKENRLYVKY